jgi:two-component system sensor histidine kinase CreC
MVTIRTRIIAGMLCIVAIGFFYLVNWVVDDLRPHYMKSMEESLVDESVLLASIIEQMIDSNSIKTQMLRDAFKSAHRRRFDAAIYDLLKNQMNIRVYITDDNGIVLFDSDDSKDEGKDYSNWNDVRRTLKGEYGARTSHSIPGDQSTSVLYVAAPIRVDTAIIGVLTVCKPSGSVTFFVNKAQKKIIYAGCIIGFGVLIVSIALSIWVTSPIKRLTNYARSVRDGKPVQLPRLGISSYLGRSEVGLMGKAFEEMRQTLEGKKYVEQYVQTVTHEIKGPIAAIRGAAELIDDKMPADDRERFLRNIRIESERMQSIVDRLLELTVLESRANLREREEIDLCQIVQACVKTVAPACEAKRLRCEMVLSVKATLQGERFLITQAILNCLQNSIDFTPNGGYITVSLEKNGTSAKLLIDDTGCGIPDYALDKVFDRFYSLSRPDTKRKSTGLGLSFVREAILLHGGTVSVANREQCGTRVTITLPIEC